MYSHQVTLIRTMIVHTIKLNQLHIQQVNKATKVLNFIKCTLYKCTKEVKETAFTCD